MVNYYEKMKKGIFTTLAVGALASTVLYGSNNVSAKEIEERMISREMDNSTIQTDLEYGKKEMGDSEKQTLNVGLKTVPFKIYKTNDDNKTLYFDLGVGGTYNLNKDSGVFTFGLPYEKKDQDLKLLFDSNFLSSNNKGNGYKLNANGEVIVSGSLEDNLSSQGAEKSGFDIGLSGELLKTIYNKGNFTTFSIGGQYDHSQAKFSKDPEGRDQAIDSKYNALTFPLKMMHYNAKSNSISTVETFVNIDLDNGEIGGGVGLETMFKNFGIGIDFSKSSKGMGLNFGMEGKIGDFAIKAGVKNLFEQNNPNLWEAETKGYIGFRYDIKHNDKNKLSAEVQPLLEPKIEPKLEPAVENTNPELIEPSPNTDNSMLEKNNLIKDESVVLPNSNLGEENLESKLI